MLELIPLILRHARVNRSPTFSRSHAEKRSQHQPAFRSVIAAHCHFFADLQLVCHDAFREWQIEIR
ncbi:MAG: hypothetical protein N0E55_16940 [Candidatus Thiodiazotropha taylori]|nr:hypothetical protein [Candidatus Thiodiazotropha taylori]MCG8112196.1 hypothetical protein [Candidatus Thiodiazotropha taylori]MCW4254375.1 hypothetical protein [Candidatus Thiodiazotropha taylori]MCW4284553.1 hypothetical protein [Candidatus Thiodiazotropha taylori]